MCRTPVDSGRKRAYWAIAVTCQIVLCADERRRECCANRKRSWFSGWGEWVPLVVTRRVRLSGADWVLRVVPLPSFPDPTPYAALVNRVQS
jgi:hypothetical protein